MAVVIINDIEGGNQELYDKVNSRVMPDGELPDGCQTHIAGPTDTGWRVITVWDSDEQFQQFRNDRLIPAMQEAGTEDRIAPSIDSQPVYRFLQA